MLSTIRKKHAGKGMCSKRIYCLCCPFARMKQPKVSLVSHMLALVGYLLFACGRGMMGNLQLVSGVLLVAVVI